MDASHSKLAVIALKSPKDNRRYGFVSRAMVCGDVAAVFHYNVSPRLISELSAQLFGIPLLVFFDDFGAKGPAEITDATLNTFILFCPKLGINRKKEKSEAGRRIAFIGIEWDFPCSENGYALSVKMTK